MESSKELVRVIGKSSVCGNNLLLAIKVIHSRIKGMFGNYSGRLCSLFFFFTSAEQNQRALVGRTAFVAPGFGDDSVQQAINRTRR